MSPPPSIRSFRGFTLVELLTVIAIIGILAAIIIPVVGKVRQTARTATATSNLRQLAMAANLYTVENRTYPAGYLPGFTGTWDGQLAPFVAAANSQWGGWGGSNSRVFEDPARGVVPQHFPNGPAYALNFSANPNVFIDRGGSDTPLITPAAVRRPSQVILIATSVQKADGYSPELLRSTNDVYDSSPANADLPIFETVFADGAESGQSGGWGKVAYRHNGFALAVMVDGSVHRFAAGEIKRKNFSPYY